MTTPANEAAKIKSGNIRGALADDIKDLRNIAKNSGNRKKYDKAIKELLDYYKCLEEHGLLP